MLPQNTDLLQQINNLREQFFMSFHRFRTFLKKYMSNKYKQSNYIVMVL